MYRKIWFFCVIIYFLYQLVRCYRKKNINLNSIETTLSVLIVISAFRDWPIYLDEHLCIGILCLLYGIGSCYEWLRRRQIKDNSAPYFFLTVVSFFIVISQFGKYYNVTDFWVLSPINYIESLVSQISYL